MSLTERPRWERAEREQMRLVPIDDATLLVESESGNTYLLDMETQPPRCSCPDHRYRGVSCKHLLKALQEGAYAR